MFMRLINKLVWILVILAIITGYVTVGINGRAEVVEPWDRAIFTEEGRIEIGKSFTIEISVDELGILDGFIVFRHVGDEESFIYYEMYGTNPANVETDLWRQIGFCVEAIDEHGWT